MGNKDLIKTILEDIFGHIGISPDTEIEELEENIYDIKIEGDDLSFLIGFRGQSLEALQSILRLMMFRKIDQPLSIILDINGYRIKKAERIQELTRSFIDRVRFFEKEVTLPPMDPWERRQVHVLISEYDDIISESTGEGRGRRVVLKIK